MNRSTKGFVAAVFWAAATVAIAAETWQSRVGVGYSDYKNDEDVKSSTLSLSGDRFFAPLPLNPDYPYAETLFLERVGSVGATVGVGNFETPALEKTDTHQWSIGAALKRPDLDFTAQLGLAHAVIRDQKILNSTTSLSHEADIVNFGIGYYLQKTLLGRVDFAENKSTTRATPATFTDSEHRSRSADVSLRYLSQLANGQYFAVGADLEEFDNRTDDLQNLRLGLAGSYYLDRRQAVRLRARIDRGDNKAAEGSTVQVGYDAYLTPEIEVSGSFARFLARNGDTENDANTVLIDVSVRF